MTTINPVIKIMKPGKSLDSTDLRDFIFHSNFTCFKLDSVLSGQININSGDSSGYVDITHNLGNRAFLVYQDGQLFPSDIVAYNDGSKIRITRTLDSPYNRVVTAYYASHSFWQDSTSSFYIIAGKKINSGSGSAVRFANIALNQGQSITSANFDYNRVTTTSGADIKFKIWGINEDNTGDFGDPMGRPKTSAYRDKTQSANTNEFNWGDNWTDLAQEIVNRSGWQSGNAMGFIFEDNGSPDGKVFVAEKSKFDLSNLILTITKTGTGYLTSNYKIVIFKDKIAT